MDIVYLQQRYDRSILNMRNAVCAPSRVAHAQFAALYASRIARAGTRFPVDDV